MLLLLLFLFLLLPSSSSPSHNNDDNNDIQPSILTPTATPQEKQVLDWGIQCGVNMMHAMLQWPTQTSVGARGVVAVTDIPAQTCLFQVPSQCQIQYRHAPPHVKDMVNAVDPDVFDHEDDFVQLVIFLTDMATYPEQSEFKAYVQVLPKVVDTPSHGWSLEDIEALQFIAEIESIQERIIQRKTLYDRIMEAKNIGNYSYETFSWAWTIVETRAWYVPPERTERTLVPFIDFLNHSPHAQVRVRFDDSGQAQFISNAIKAGEEVFNNYGVKDGHETLFYGFALQNNMDEVLTLTMEESLLWLTWCTINTIPSYLHDLLLRQDIDSIQYDLGLIVQVLRDELANLPTSLENDLRMANEGCPRHHRMSTALNYRISIKTLITRHLDLCRGILRLITCLPSHTITLPIRFFHHVQKLAAHTVSILVEDIP